MGKSMSVICDEVFDDGYQPSSDGKLFILIFFYDIHILFFCFLALLVVFISDSYAVLQIFVQTKKNEQKKQKKNDMEIRIVKATLLDQRFVYGHGPPLCGSLHTSSNYICMFGLS